MPRQYQRDFIAYYRRHITHGGKERILIAGAPASHENPYRGHGTYGYHVQDTDIQVSQQRPVLEGYDGKNHHRRDKGNYRRQPVHHFVGIHGHNIFLQEHLYGIRHRLKYAQWPGAIGPEPGLHSSHCPALDIDNPHYHNQNKDNEHHGKKQPVPPETTRPVRRNRLPIKLSIYFHQINQCHYRSTSPRQISMLPKIRIRSATFQPRTISLRAVKFIRLVGRT